MCPVQTQGTQAFSKTRGVPLLNARIKRTAERLLPRFVLAWLDPVESIIGSEVSSLAHRVREGQIVLDAGAGEARHRRQFTRGRYVALDSGTGDPGWNYSNLDVRADLERLPLRKESVDHVLCMVVLEHTRNPHLVLAEIARVLKSRGSLHMVIPFLWEEHQAPHDYFRFTRYGARLLFESLPLRIEVLEPLGGFFWLCARRSVSLLTFFQQGWRWVLFALLAPFFGFLIPIALYFMDGLDSERNFSLGFRIRATRE